MCACSIIHHMYSCARAFYFDKSAGFPPLVAVGDLHLVCALQEPLMHASEFRMTQSLSLSQGNYKMGRDGLWMSSV